jgi:hypothetical protein
MWLNRFAVQHLIPYIDTGVIIKTESNDADADTGPPVTSMDGCIQFIAPGATACFDCLNRGNAEQARIEQLTEDELEEELARGYIDGTDLTPQPAVVGLNGVIAAKTVLIVSKYLTELDEPENYTTYEDLSNELIASTATPTRHCPTCGETGILGRGDRQPTEIDIERVHQRVDLDHDTTGIRTPDPGTELTAEERAALNNRLDQFTGAGN